MDSVKNRRPGFFDKLLKHFLKSFFKVIFWNQWPNVFEAFWKKKSMTRGFLIKFQKVFEPLFKKVIFGIKDQSFFWSPFSKWNVFSHFVFCTPPPLQFFVSIKVFEIFTSILNLFILSLNPLYLLAFLSFRWTFTPLIVQDLSDTVTILHFFVPICIFLIFCVRFEFFWKKRFFRGVFFGRREFWKKGVNEKLAPFQNHHPLAFSIIGSEKVFWQKCFHNSPKNSVWIWRGKFQNPSRLWKVFAGTAHRVKKSSVNFKWNEIGVFFSRFLC